MSEDEVPRLKFVVVGDGASGKTSLLQRFADNTFTADYTPTIFENRSKHVQIDGKQYELTLWDTAGQEDYDQIRVLAYKDVDMILLLYSFDLKFSLQNVTEKWIEEVRKFNKNVPVFLIAAKNDLKNEPGAVKIEEGVRVQREIKAASFAECSSKTGENVEEIFTRATRIVLTGKTTEKKQTCGFGQMITSCFKPS